MNDSVTVPREKLEHWASTAKDCSTTLPYLMKLHDEMQALLNSSSEPQAQAGEKTVMEIPISYGHLDANALEQVAKEHPNKYFLKGSGVLKLITAIRELEQKLAAAEARERHTKETLNKLLAAPPQ
jgi:hypothetical protein